MKALYLRLFRRNISFYGGPILFTFILLFGLSHLAKAGIEQDICAPQTFTEASTDNSRVLNYEACSQDISSEAAYQFWSPVNAPLIKGIIVLVSDFHKDETGTAETMSWRALADKYHLAIVSYFMRGPRYRDPEEGAGMALLSAIDNFSQRTGHAELSRAPLLLYSESDGSVFDYSFALWNPGRVMAFVVNQAKYDDVRPPSSAVLAVPGLFIFRQTDLYSTIAVVTNIWTEGRKQGALWALAPEPGCGADLGRGAAMAESFFEGALQNDLTKFVDTSTITKRDSSTGEKGWIGNLSTYQIQDATKGNNFSLDVAWLPTENTAKAWNAFVTSKD